MIHLPYQVNIMQLWENLGNNIIHFIPSKKFIKELIWNNDWYSWEEKYREPCLFEKSIDLSEWYQEENEDYFIYFNSWEDLKLKTKEYILEVLFLLKLHMRHMFRQQEDFTHTMK